MQHACCWIRVHTFKARKKAEHGGKAYQILCILLYMLLALPYMVGTWYSVDFHAVVILVFEIAICLTEFATL